MTHDPNASCEIFRTCTFIKYCLCKYAGQEINKTKIFGIYSNKTKIFGIYSNKTKIFGIYSNKTKIFGIYSNNFSPGVGPKRCLKIRCESTGEHPYQSVILIVENKLWYRCSSVMCYIFSQYFFIKIHIWYYFSLFN